MEERVVAGFSLLEGLLGLFEDVLGGLLDEDVVVAFPGEVDIVVVVDVSYFAVGRVTVAAHGLSALLNTLGCEPARLGLYDRGDRVELLDERIILLHEFLHVVVAERNVVHRGPVVYQVGSQQRHQSSPHHRILHQFLLLPVVLALELSPRVGVPDGDGQGLKSKRTAVGADEKPSA